MPPVSRIHQYNCRKSRINQTFATRHGFVTPLKKPSSSANPMACCANSILRFSYLWKRQAAAGEESGRKARPVGVVVRTAAIPGVVFLFPITSQLPDTDRLSLGVSQWNARAVWIFRAGLFSRNTTGSNSTRHSTSSQRGPLGVSVPPSSRKSRSLSKMPLQPEG